MSWAEIRRATHAGARSADRAATLLRAGNQPAIAEVGVALVRRAALGKLEAPLKRGPMYVVVPLFVGPRFSGATRDAINRGR